MSEEKVISVNPLAREFYDRHADEVAVGLLGKSLVREKKEKILVGRIVETEAYLGPHDLACHSSKKSTKRAEVMFGPPGFAYVYMVYGMHNLLNAVTGPGENPSAVLLRAIEPLKNIDDKTCGPALLCRAMHIDRSFNGHDLTCPSLYIAESAGAKQFEMEKKPRIGVDYAGAWAGEHLRFYIRDSRYVSRR
ncbi:MAG: DNA-3-methyladenine glycosylase [Desulfobacterales bacterium]